MRLRSQVAYSMTDYFSIAAKSFGKFQDSFLLELHAEILLHEKQAANGTIPQPVEGITVVDSDVLEPPPARQGGLQRVDTVSIENPFHLILKLKTPQRHTFKKPAKLLEPPTPGASILGLDRLAQEKRAARADESRGESSRKRPRTGDEPVFKGEVLFPC